MDDWDDFETPKKQPSSAQEVYASFPLKLSGSELRTLDLTDLLILEAVTKADGMMTRGIGEAVHLSSKAALARSRKLTKLNLLTCQVISSQKGGIQAANLFFPASSLTLKAIQEAIDVLCQKPLGGEQRMEEQSRFDKSEIFLASLDIISLLILGLIGRGEADTAKLIQIRLRLSNSPVRSRLSQLLKANFLNRTEKHPFMHRPGIKEYHYSLSSSVDPNQIQIAISKIDPTKLPNLIGLEVFRLNTGSGQFSFGGIPSNGNKPSSNDGISKEITSSPLHKETEIPLSSLQAFSGATDKVWKVLRAMAEKIAEYEERIAKLEARDQDRVASEASDEILALIPPRNY